MLNGLEIWQFLAIAGAFFAAGTVKGILGLGLPLVAVPLVASVTEPAMAIALLAVPALSSNGWQAVQTGHQGEVFRRFWPLLVALVAGVLIGAQFLADLDPRLIARGLGTVVLVFVASRILPVRFTVSSRAEGRVGVLFGMVAGLIGGATSFFGPVLAPYLVALNLAKDLFVSAIALFFLMGYIPLYASLAVNGLLGLDQIVASTLLGAIPVAAGLALGRRLRRHVPQATFEHILLAIIAAIGVSLIVRSLG